MRYTLRFAALLVLVPLIAHAQDDSYYECSFGGNIRRVEILYTEPGTALPCEVHYTKDSEAPGQIQVLWAAQNEAGYCDYQAREFVSKLEGWGWSCEDSSQVPAEDSAEAAAEMLGDESLQPDTTAQVEEDAQRNN